MSKEFELDATTFYKDKEICILYLPNPLSPHFPTSPDLIGPFPVNNFRLVYAMLMGIV